MIDTNRLRELLAKATPGPWTVRGRVHSSGEAIRIEGYVEGDPGYQVADVIDANGNAVNQANLDLILSARNALPALLDDLERIERNRDMWKGQCERQAEQLTAMRQALEHCLNWLPEDSAAACEARAAIALGDKS